MNFSEKTKIRHRHEVNATFSKMALPEKRVLFMAIAQVNPRKLIEQRQVFRVTASAYASIADVSISHAYRQLKEAAEQLQKSTLEIPKKDLLPIFARAGDPLIPSRKRPERERKGIRILNLTEYIDYEEGDGFIEISFTRQMEPYICLLAEGFTTQVLLSAVRLSDSNSANFYQLIRKNISQGRTQYFDIEVDELKEELRLFKMNPDNGELEYSYPDFKEFNRCVLKKMVKSILEVTEIESISIDVIEKLRRKANKLRVSYKYNNLADGAIEDSDNEK